MKDEKQGIFDSAKNVKLVLRLLYVGCLLLFILDFIIHRHSVHNWEKIWGFYPLYGFVSCVVLVIVASWMRPFLIRDENYYADEGSHPLNSSEDKKQNERTSVSSKESKDSAGGKHVDD